ncbi:hypothetical protein SAMN02745121_05032 [Nannocystis exedens]|uniref:Uncharacterized protein n=1 Tax=Nannocystis exedens TaxID=54 RepID=A0A1I2CD65_9BACT|nr:hypothetical protein [Nannocystis exedens]PCC68401.1 hypothetical protein NAEX_01412 [Nannocystis exedens]SFE65620.1 hypothetical protein SAMN02745121_05032 [Nannocystis exedens]
MILDGTVAHGIRPDRFEMAEYSYSDMAGGHVNAALAEGLRDLIAVEGVYPSRDAPQMS